MADKIIVLDICPEEQLLLDIETEAPLLILDTEGTGYTGGGVNIEIYDGEYNVVPADAKQTLETKSRYLKENVTVEAVPTYTVTNTAGGTTFIIG